MMFKRDDKVILMDNKGMVAKKGAKAVVVRATEEEVDVKWLNSRTARGQSDGVYFRPSVRFMLDKKWRIKRPERRLVI